MNNKLRRILSVLIKFDIIKDIQNLTNIFFDEPKFYFYTSVINNTPALLKKGGFITSHVELMGHGVSFTSRKTALLKCIAEGLERLMLFCYRPKKIFYTQNIKLLPKNIMDLSDYQIKNNKKIFFGLVKGEDLVENKDCFIPAQLVFLNYKLRPKELNLSTRISTGAAGGFSKEDAIIRGIYEIVERDAFLTIYLNKISVPVLDIDAINDDEIQYIIKKIIRYNLSVYILNITNDLKIPSFATVIVDKSGMGPSISVGLKSSFNQKDAIIGSLEEAVSIARVYLRYHYIKKGGGKNKIQLKNIKDALDRGMYWYDKSMINNLDFLLNSIPTNKLDVNDKKSVSLNKLVDVLNRKGYKIYCHDLSLQQCRKIPYFIYKVLIPGLQPLYLNENFPELKMERLKKVADHFDQKNNINKIPHPFL